MYRRKPICFAVLVTLFFSGQASAAAYLGVVLAPPSEDAKGAVVANVIDGSPAAKAKLAGGDVIVVVNDTNIKNARALVAAIRSLKAGDEIKVKIRRDVEEKTLTVKLGERPEPGHVVPKRPAIGIAVQRPDDSGKVIVAAIFPGSAAEDAKIKPGDVVVEFDGKKINAFEQLAKLAQEKKVGDEVSLKIERDGETIEKKLKLKGS